MTGPQTARAVDKFLAYFEELKKLHVAVAGHPLEMYKGTEAPCLAQVFDAIEGLALSGVDFIAELVHRLAWGQCLGNGNHRTTTLFVADFLSAEGIQFPWYAGEADPDARFKIELNQWIGRSQALIRRRGEPGFAQARLEPRHREITHEWVAQMVGPQSEAVTMIGPQRLMNFIS